MRISHTGFIVGFCAALYGVCNALNIGRLAQWFRPGDSLDVLALAAYLVAGLGLFIAVFTLLAHRWTIKPFAILLAVASGIATYFIAKYGVAVDSSMVRNAIHTDPTEVGQLMTWQMLPYVALLVILPVVLIWRTDITFAPGGRYLWGSLKLFGAALGLALLLLFLQYQAIYRAGNVSNKYIVYTLVPINLISASVNVATKEIKPWFQTSQKDLKVDATVTTPGNLVVVLAVGEASRRKNFSLYGYARRDTNPELKAVDGLHALDAIATRASTLYALPKILKKGEVNLTTLTSKAGIPTTCYVNYTLYDNCSAIGETKAGPCGHGGKCYDEDVLPLLKRDLESYKSGYRFLVLHLGGGSHGPLYKDRHPPEFLKFEPVCADADVANKCTLEQVYNAYDNTILYVDHVVAQAIRTLDAARVPYVFIYLSDHGESLLENGVMFHGMPPGMALPDEQAQIPLIVKSSVPLAVAPRAEYGQPDVFDSVLDLFTIRSPGFDRAGSFLKRSPSN
jgi:lipid A ethanolaminephosphotransferase